MPSAAIATDGMEDLMPPDVTGVANFCVQLRKDPERAGDDLVRVERIDSDARLGIVEGFGAVARRNNVDDAQPRDFAHDDPLLLAAKNRNGAPLLRRPHPGATYRAAPQNAKQRVVSGCRTHRAFRPSDLRHCGRTQSVVAVARHMPSPRAAKRSGERAQDSIRNLVRVRGASRSLRPSRFSAPHPNPLPAVAGRGSTPRLPRDRRHALQNCPRYFSPYVARVMSGTLTPSSIALQRTASAFAFCSAASSTSSTTSRGMKHTPVSSATTKSPGATRTSPI